MIFFSNAVSGTAFSLNLSMKKIILSYHFLMMGFFGMLIQSCSTKQKISQNNVEQKIYNLPYGDNKRNIMDVFLPAHYSPETPFVMLVHGGAWMFGDKSHLRNVQKFLHKNNIPTASINYRLLNNEVTYKSQQEDVGKAVETVISNLPQWKNKNSKIILLGESAGAHLSLLYGFQHPEKISKIISMGGPTDLYSENYLNSSYHQKTKRVFQKVVGEKYSSDNREAFRKASPLSVVSNVPTLIFQGDRDFLVNEKQGKSLDSVMTEKNFPHKLIFMKNTGHIPRLVKKKRDSIVFPEILQFIKE